jgi:hypothetical protein
MNGRIVLDQPQPTEPPVQQIQGSPIEATAEKIQEMTQAQTEAIQTLGGKLSGGTRVEVQNVPNLVSAGNVDAKSAYADLLKLQAQANTDATYDGLGKAAPVTVGGRKRKTARKNKKHGKKKRSSIRSNRRTLRRTRRVRHTRR